MAEKTDFDTIEHSNFVLKGRISAPEVYADGMSHFAMFGPMSKMLLHSISWPTTGVSIELRRAILNLTMPTANAIELAHFILSAAKSAEARILEGMDAEQAARIKNILKDVPEGVRREIVPTGRKKK
jgi:hypothetical protein